VIGPGRPVTEEDLHAYVDDLLDPEPRATVDRYLQAHPREAERATAYAAQQKQLRGAFAARAAEPIPSQLNLLRLVEARLMQRRISWRTAAGVVILALALAGTGGWWLGNHTPAGIDALAHEAALNYSVYAVDDRRPVEVWARNEGTLCAGFPTALTDLWRLPN
jgi:anti-sigma factor RsiW